MSWQVLATDSANTRWNVFRAGTKVAVIDWIETLDYPLAALDRIRNGLNGVHGDRQPPRCWWFGDHLDEGTWEIHHNGKPMGAITWLFPPRCEPEIWQDRILAGLNFVSAARHGLTPPAPAAPRTLRVAS